MLGRDYGKSKMSLKFLNSIWNKIKFQNWKKRAYKKMLLEGWSGFYIKNLL